MESAAGARTYQDGRAGQHDDLNPFLPYQPQEVVQSQNTKRGSDMEKSIAERGSIERMYIVMNPRHIQNIDKIQKCINRSENM